jgi:arginyl-tRNA synthetase
VASAFASFYEVCPVLGAEDEAIRGSRMALCDLTARTISTGLGLLGIDSPEQM